MLPSLLVSALSSHFCLHEGNLKLESHRGITRVLVRARNVNSINDSLGVLCETRRPVRYWNERKDGNVSVRGDGPTERDDNVISSSLYYPGLEFTFPLNRSWVHRTRVPRGTRVTAPNSPIGTSTSRSTDNLRGTSVVRPSIMDFEVEVHYQVPTRV